MVPIAAAAALAASLAGLQSWAGEAASDAETLPLGRLAQAQQGSDADAAAAQGESEAGETPEFSEEVLADPEVVAMGEAIWQEQCRHCHGSSAYPGKAPKLRPRRYDPEFVYNRVTFGFRGMPGWKDAYSDEERVAITAYVLSDDFSP